MKQLRDTSVSKSRKSIVAALAKKKNKVQVIEVKLQEKMPLPKPTASTLRPFKEAAKLNQKMFAAKVKREKEKSTFLAKPFSKGKVYKIDLRLRSPESLSVQSMNSVEAAPALVRLARVKGLNSIAITDFHDWSQIDLTKKASQGTTVNVIPGMCVNCSVTTDSSITTIVLFPENYTSAEIEKCALDLNIPASAKGRSDFILKKDYSEFLKVIESHGAIAIPTRIDLTPHHLLSVSRLVEEFGMHCFDLAHVDNPQYFKDRWPNGEFTFLSFSNASSLAQVGSRLTKIKLPKAGFDGIKELVKRRS